jgi:hypothetical protein
MYIINFLSGVRGCGGFEATNLNRALQQMICIVTSSKQFINNY